MKIAIGIPTYAEPSGLRATLDHLLPHTAMPHEIILLPDGLDQATRTALAAFGDFRQLGTEEPQGTAACFNRLVTSSRADLYVLLESGAVVGPGWLDRLILALFSDPRHGLAGPSTNRCWNSQAIHAAAEATSAEVMHHAHEASRRFGNALRTLEPLHSLADFCYAVRREVIESIGLADEGYRLGPCWEMDYNIRAARSGWRGVWVGGAYVHRAPFTERRRREEARWFEASKHRYQDRFCGARLRGEKTDYRTHCRGDACPNFAPARLLVERGILPSPVASDPVPAATPGLVSKEADGAVLVSCIMPTFDRLQFVPQAIEGFLRQDYQHLELIVVDDGAPGIESLLPPDPRIRLIRLPKKERVGTKRNAACAAARGQLIMHWDDDDWYPPDRVRQQADALADKRFEICGTSTLYYFEAATGRSWRYCYAGHRAWVAGNTLAYRKSWWSAHPFPEVQVGEDSRFVWSVAAPNICDLRRPGLCVARIHHGNTSRKATGSSFWQSCEVSELEHLLGPDWNEFVAPGPNSPRTSQPLVSCIMPTFNRRAFLALALDAFVGQDYPNKELIIVDDGPDQALEFVRGSGCVRHIPCRQRISIGRKRNLACEAARGDIIAHWDDDDWYDRNRLSYQVAPLLAGSADLTGLENAFQLELATGEFWRPNAALHRRMFVGDVHGGTLVYWKSLFDEGLRYPDRNLAEDAMLLREAMQRGKTLLRLNNPGLFVYMRHGHNSWRFQSGQFLDRDGWERLARPEWFSDKLMDEFRQAAGAQCGPVPL